MNIQALKSTANEKGIIKSSIIVIVSIIFVTTIIWLGLPAGYWLSSNIFFPVTIMIYDIITNFFELILSLFSSF